MPLVSRTDHAWGASVPRLRRVKGGGRGRGRGSLAFSRRAESM